MPSKNWLNGALAMAIAVFLAGCGGLRADIPETVVIPNRVELGSGDSNSFNYTPWYIHTFSISSPKGSGIGGGGGNTIPMYEDGTPSRGGGGGKCCTSYPIEWQPDLRLTVRWKVDKKQDGKTPGYWYKAENVQWPQYDGRQAGGVWAIFLPGDRVKVMIADGNANGHNSVAVRPSDDDPYVAQGVLDEEWNRLYR